MKKWNCKKKKKKNAIYNLIEQNEKRSVLVVLLEELDRILLPKKRFQRIGVSLHKNKTAERERERCRWGVGCDGVELE